MYKQVRLRQQFQLQQKYIKGYRIRKKVRMEKISFSLERKKKTLQNQFVNQYSYLNVKRDSHDTLNSLNADLQKLKRGSFGLPSISAQRKNIINGLAQKLALLQNKIKERNTEGNRNYTSIYTQRPLIPYPINYQLPTQAPQLAPPPMPFPPYPYPFPPHMNGNCCPQCHTNKKKPKKNRKKNKKAAEEVKEEVKEQIQQVKEKKKNRFRIYAYAIYFCIYFRCYSKKFTQNRKNWFNDRYRDSQRGIIFKGSEKVLFKLQQLDFYQMFLDSKVNKHITGEQNAVIDWQDYTKTALVPNTSIIPKHTASRQSPSEYIINLTQLSLQKLGQILLDDEFIKQYHQVFSAGSLDLSFMINNLYLPEETPFLFVHPVKGYLRLSYSEEIQILLVKVMVKMFIYNYLLAVYRIKGWNKKLQSMHKLAQYQVEELWDVLRTVAIYLYIICKQMYIQGVQNLNHNSNFYEVCKKFGIRQAKHLEQKKIIQDQEGDQKQKPFELIRNIRNYEITYEKLTKNHRLMQYKSVIKQRIVDFLSKLHDKLKRQERQLYSYIKNMTLALPYLILSNLAKQKQEKDKKQRQLKILQPNEKKGKPWHEMYSNSSYINNSLDSQASKTRKIKFQDDPNLDNISRIQKNGNININTSATSRVGTQYNGNRQNNENKENKDEYGNARKGLEVSKPKQMKKAFNIDTVNGKYDQNRQDRLRQKFRNYFAKG